MKRLYAFLQPHIVPGAKRPSKSFRERMRNVGNLRASPLTWMGFEVHVRNPYSLLDREARRRFFLSRPKASVANQPGGSRVVQLGDRRWRSMLAQVASAAMWKGLRS